MWRPSVDGLRIIKWESNIKIPNVFQSMKSEKEYVTLNTSDQLPFTQLNSIGIINIICKWSKLKQRPAVHRSRNGHWFHVNCVLLTCTKMLSDIELTLNNDLLDVRGQPKETCNRRIMNVNELRARKQLPLQISTTSGPANLLINQSLKLYTVPEI